MIVNETKTKIMCFGKSLKPELYFNGKLIEEANHYKYLGNILRSVQRSNQDLFMANYQYICDQARKAILSLYRKTKAIKALPPDNYVSYLRQRYMGLQQIGRQYIG